MQRAEHGSLIDGRRKAPARTIGAAAGQAAFLCVFVYVLCVDAVALRLGTAACLCSSVGASSLALDAAPRRSCSSVRDWRAALTSGHRHLGSWQELNDSAV